MNEMQAAVRFAEQGMRTHILGNPKQQIHAFHSLLGFRVAL